MILLDVNVLVYAYRADAADHQAYRRWLEDVVNGDSAFGLSDLVLSGVLRVLTHPGIFKPPNSIRDALAFVAAVRSSPSCVGVDPGRRHWDIFARLCDGTSARGNHVPDAWLAALAIESGSEWITTDRGFARYPGLKWRHPLH